MPKGVKGFLPGRSKTGGRTKGAKNRKDVKLIDQLKNHGFNYAKELAACLNALPPEQRFAELRSLLPYMAPKLKDAGVEPIDDDESSTSKEAPSISDEDLLRAINGTEKSPTPKPSNPPPVEKRAIELQAAPSPEVNLSDMAREQEEN